MKYIILLFLFITSCTDKKQTTEPIVIEPEPIIEEVIEPEPVKLSYDKGLDLMLVSTSFEDTWDNILDKREEGLGYYAIYWDSYNNLYYTVTNDIVLLYPIPVTNTNFVYTIDKTKQFEPIFHLAMKEVFTNTGAPLLYIGSISPLERVYLDPTNQIYYIKYLAPWDTSIYTVYVTEDTCTTNSNTLPIFPFYKPSIYTNYHEASESYIISTNDKEPFIYYTNSDGDKFFGINPDTPLSIMK